MTYGCMLIKLESGSPVGLMDEIRALKGVVDVYPVFGRFDLVVFIHADGFYDLKDAADDITEVDGLLSTETLIEWEDID